MSTNVRRVSIHEENRWPTTQILQATSSSFEKTHIYQNPENHWKRPLFLHSPLLNSNIKAVMSDAAAISPQQYGFYRINVGRHATEVWAPVNLSISSRTQLLDQKHLILQVRVEVMAMRTIMLMASCRTPAHQHFLLRHLIYRSLPTRVVCCCSPIKVFCLCLCHYDLLIDQQTLILSSDLLWFGTIHIF